MAQLYQENQNHLTDNDSDKQDSAVLKTYASKFMKLSKTKVSKK